MDLQEQSEDSHQELHGLEESVPCNDSDSEDTFDPDDVPADNSARSRAVPSRRRHWRRTVQSRRRRWRRRM